VFRGFGKRRYDQKAFFRRLPQALVHMGRVCRFLELIAFRRWQENWQTFPAPTPFTCDQMLGRGGAKCLVVRAQ